MNDDSCSVALYLYGNSISLDGATELVGIVPTRVRNRGEIRLTSTGSRVVQKIGFWGYIVNVERGDILKCLNDLINQICADKIVGEVGIEKAELDIFIPVDVTDEVGGFSIELSSVLLRRLSGLGIDLVITSR